ncbi:transcriptional regulator FtrA [Trinickia acidisoli]|uniref:transcriptional regulator FtrA n=1 Tax=Trinickia acidisoli TaxID=2767482 RepID=UPI001A8F2E80|nr:transcriptional regulator FtrA [Trinickia acidisoli]
MPPRSSLTVAPSRVASPVVGVLAYDGVNAFEFGIAVEVFGLRNMGANWYRVVVCADQPKHPLLLGFGVKLLTDAGLACLEEASTIIVPGWHDIDAVPPEPLLETLRHAHARGVRIASICSGVFVLAAAGLLDGRRAAVHWAQADALARRYPNLLVDPRVLYVDDGDILSSAGRAAGLDLCVHIVRRDYGAAVANEVARRLVIPAHREGGQAQFISVPVRDEGDPLADVLAWARMHLDEDMTIDTLADKTGMSRRTFIRHFERATGVSPGEWVLQERITQARQLLEDTAMPIEDVATACGFGSADTLRHHFRVRFGTSPGRYRASLLHDPQPQRLARQPLRAA